MVVNHNKYRLFEYENNPSKNDEFILGEVVINEDNEIGVIIQCHGNNEYRTDQFGNCCSDNVTKASQTQILKHRPKLLN